MIRPRHLSRNSGTLSLGNQFLCIDGRVLACACSAVALDTQAESVVLRGARTTAAAATATQAAAALDASLLSEGDWKLPCDCSLLWKISTRHEQAQAMWTCRRV